MPNFVDDVRKLAMDDLSNHWWRDLYRRRCPKEPANRKEHSVRKCKYWLKFVQHWLFSSSIRDSSSRMSGPPSAFQGGAHSFSYLLIWSMSNCLGKEDIKENLSEFDYRFSLFWPKNPLTCKDLTSRFIKWWNVFVYSRCKIFLYSAFLHLPAH